MEWKTTWNDPLTSYVAAFDNLIGERNEPGQALFRLYIFDRWTELFGVVS
jgi:hypothetical protein